MKLDFNDCKKLALAMAKGAAIGGAAAGALMFLVAPGKATPRQKAPFMGLNVAHRGLHNREMSVPENSLEAFRLAAEAGYGIELDVQFSKDKQVVVFHDDTLDRVCGVHARVDELDYAELKKLSLCGTNYSIPLFTEVLAVIGGRSPIICELKNGRANRELCEKTYEILCSYRGEVCVESFNPLIVAWFRRHAKDLLRGQLAQPPRCYDDGSVSAPLAHALGHTLLNVLARPQFIAYRIGRRPLTVRLSEALGAMRVGWTSHEARNESGRDTVIFEFYRPQTKFKNY